MKLKDLLNYFDKDELVVVYKSINNKLLEIVFEGEVDDAKSSIYANDYVIHVGQTELLNEQYIKIWLMGEKR